MRRDARQVASDRFFEDTVVALPDKPALSTPELVAASLILEFRKEVLTKLDQLQPGQGLAAVFRVEIVTSDGTLPTDAAARLSSRAAEWRRHVFERDGYCCRDCGASGKLNAHHIQSWAGHPERRYDMDNGVTVCLDCHAARHPKLASLIRKARYHRPRTRQHA